PHTRAGPAAAPSTPMPQPKRKLRRFGSMSPPGPAWPGIYRLRPGQEEKVPNWANLLRHTRSRSPATLNVHTGTPRVAGSLGPRLARNLAQFGGRGYFLVVACLAMIWSLIPS